MTTRHMQPQVVRADWFTIDYANGLTSPHVPGEGMIDAIDGAISALSPGEAFEVTYHGFGYGARMSAPGYTDRTDWIAPYDDENAALDALYDLYGDGDGLYAERDRFGGMTIHFPDGRSVYFQPGDEANKAWEEYDNCPNRWVQDDWCRQYDHVAERPGGEV